MDEKTAIAIAADLQNLPRTAARSARYLAQIADTNQRIRDVADSHLAFDSSPLSFPAFKATMPCGGDSTS